MNKSLSLFFRRTIVAFSVTTVCYSPAFCQDRKTENNWVSDAEQLAVYQLKKAASIYNIHQNPRSINADGSVRLVTIRDWTNGFFPGSLWYGYELSQEPDLAADARRFTLALDSVQHITNTHDLGFMLYCSYGNAYRLTADSTYLPVLRQGAKHLYARYNPHVGAIRSWDFGPWEFPVIIDNMMNLEFLFWASQQFHVASYFEAANQHAKTTLRHHFRPNSSSYHLINYDATSGKVISKETHQGLTHESSWARGQAWGLYGYVMAYENTKEPLFLKQAEKIAKFIMQHPRMPDDKIPAWDFDVHNALEKQGAPRDVSAAAVIASALLQLSKQAPNGQLYMRYAEDILRTLCSEKYLSKKDENAYFILKHSVGAFLYNSEIDTPINYADYYFLEALVRYKALINNKLASIKTLDNGLNPMV
jgi:unsaturated chondroitin disaccharide hydrolase